MSASSDGAGDRGRARDDEARLAHLGYPQQLLRALGGFGNFAVAFSIISVLTGAVSLYGYGMRYGGPFGVACGWALVSLMTLPVALSMAALASSYPTAGALYHWSSFLGGRGAGWLTAWLNLLGQLAITAGIDWGLAEFLAPAAPVAVRAGLCALLLATHALLNHVGIRVVSLLGQVSAWYHMAGVAVTVTALGLLARHHPLAFLAARTVDASVATDVGARGHGYAYAFAVSLLMAGFTYTGYDASAHVSEETRDASRAAPRGIVLSVVLSALFGGALVVAVTLSVTDPARVADPEAVGFAEALGQALPGRAALAHALVGVAMGAMWFCGLASVTSCSRMVFAFARDGGMPAATRWARVSSRFHTPANAVWLSATGALAIALLCAAYGAARGEGTGDVLGRITSAATVGLYLSYGLPIAVGWRARRAGRWTERGPWDLGRATGAVNAVAVLWIAAFAVVCVLPPNGMIAALFAVALGALGAYWWLDVRHRFRGPLVAATWAATKP